MRAKDIMVVVVSAMLLGSGCASVVSRSKWPVTINSNPSGANVTIKDRRGKELQKGTTPMTAVLPSKSRFMKRATYKFTFEKKGYDPATVSRSARMNGWYFGNILFGPFGMFGMLIVDPATGAMWKLDGAVCGNLSPAPIAAPLPPIQPPPVIPPVKSPVATNVAPAPKPRFSISAYIEDDPAKGAAILGNGDGRIQKGEAFDLLVVVTNTGDADAKAVTCMVTLPADRSLIAFSELKITIAEFTPAAAITNRINLAMPSDAALIKAPTCSIEVTTPGTDFVERSNYVLPMGPE